MLNVLPKHVDAHKLGKQNVILDGAIPLSSLERVHQSGQHEKGEVYARISFSYIQGITLIEAEIQAGLTLVCQRCLEPMGFDVKTGFRYLLCDSGANENDVAAAVQSGFEKIENDGKDLCLHDLIEEELVLALPLVVKHDLESCPAKGYIVTTDTKQDYNSDKESPFAVLKDKIRKHEI